MKIKKIILIAFMLPTFSVMTACSTMQDVVQAKDSGSEGTIETYAVTEGQAWDIAKTVFRWEGSDAIEEHKEQHYMLTSSGMNLVSYGAVMGAWIEPVGGSSTKVTVVTKRRVKLNVATTLTETTFHRRFAQAVAIVKSGKSLPAVAPD